MLSRSRRNHRSSIMKNLQTYLKVRESLTNFLKEDIGTGDITSNSIISPNISARAQIICKTKKTAMICGLEEARMVFDICDCRAQPLVKDGTTVRRQTVVMEL
jgi:nicotinate-nucleotide pyrophosphorylase (carboxylating)